MDSSGVDYLWIIVMFLSAVILTAPIHCRASTGEQVMQCYFSKSDEEINSSTFWMTRGWGNRSFISPHKPAVSRMNGNTFRFTKCTDEFLSFWPCRNSQSAAGRTAGECGVAMETAFFGATEVRRSRSHVQFMDSLSSRHKLLKASAADDTSSNS